MKKNGEQSSLNIEETASLLISLARRKLYKYSNLPRKYFNHLQLHSVDQITLGDKIVVVHTGAGDVVCEMLVLVTAGPFLDEEGQWVVNDDHGQRWFLSDIGVEPNLCGGWSRVNWSYKFVVN